MNEIETNKSTEKDDLIYKLRVLIQKGYDCPINISTATIEELYIAYTYIRKRAEQEIWNEKKRALRIGISILQKYSKNSNLHVDSTIDQYDKTAILNQKLVGAYLETQGLLWDYYIKDDCIWCFICHKKMIKLEPYRLLPCEHILHMNCLDKHCEKNFCDESQYSCPICGKLF